MITYIILVPTYICVAALFMGYIRQKAFLGRDGILPALVFATIWPISLLLCAVIYVYETGKNLGKGK